MTQYYVIYRDSHGLQVADQIFDNVPEAKAYVDKYLTKPAQGRIVELKGFQCPFSGEWLVNDSHDIEKEYLT